MSFTSGAFSSKTHVYMYIIKLMIVSSLLLLELHGLWLIINSFVLLSYRLDRMSKHTTMVHQVFGGYYRSQGKSRS